MTRYGRVYKTKKPPSWEALEFSFSFLHRKSASRGGLNKKENKKAEYFFVHEVKLKL
jgi:hypothetical protein|tara:strand:- start:5068 stop:5238 length:171 start_codon:yes stop_codon:yes gene_type:complete